MTLNIFDTVSDKTLIIGGAAIALTIAAGFSYHLDKKKAKENKENEYPEEDVFDPILDEEDEA